MPNTDPDRGINFKVCTIPSDLTCTCVPKQQVMAEVEKHGFSEDAAFAIKLALEEALTNAVKHGNRNDADKSVIVRYSVDSNRAIIIVRDEGPGFEPDCVPDCTSPDRLPLPNGRGIMLIRHYMDEVAYRECGREIRFVKRRS